MYGTYATSKRTVSVPVARPTAKSCQIVSASSAHASGTDASTSARPKSAAISSGRRRSRSTQTPAGSVTSRNGRYSSAPRSATSNGVASSVTIAASGRASSVICDPNCEIVCAPQRRRKSA